MEYLYPRKKIGQWPAWYGRLFIGLLTVMGLIVWGNVIPSESRLAHRLGVLPACPPLEGDEMYFEQRGMIFSCGPDTAEWQMFARVEGGIWLEDLVVSPDGRWLYLEYYDHSDLVALEPSNAVQRPDSESPWSADSQYVLRQTEDGDTWHLYSFDVATRTEVELALNTYTNGLWWSWSPQGHTLVFGEMQTNGVVAVFTIEADGTNRHLIVNDTGIDPRPMWTPDGQSIIFRNYGEGTLAVVDSVTGDIQQQVVGSLYVVGHHRIDPWSPDHAYLAYNTGSISLVNFATGESHTLIDSPADMFLGWSPDSRSVLYSTESGLYITTTATGDTIQLADQSIFDAYWSPDGQRIAYEDNEETLYVVDADGGDPVLIASGVMEWNWSATGHALFYLSENPEWGYLYEPQTQISTSLGPMIWALTWRADGEDLRVKRTASAAGG
jgi:Tol biopolymer transport system component